MNTLGKAWKIEIERRVEEIRTGKVKPIPGEKVFKIIQERYKQ